MPATSSISNQSLTAEKDKEFKVSIYSLLAQLYFFFNSLLLPKGLLYTSILSPYFFYQQVMNNRKTYWKQFFSILFVFDLIHLILGVELVSFLKSNILFVLTYFSVISVYHFFNNYTKLNKIYKQILLVNFIFALLSVIFFFLPPDYQDWFWWVNRKALGKNEFPRLKLFTYEASYYSLLLVPVVYYYILKFFFNQITSYKWLTLLVVLIPLLMSMSFGVIGASILTLLVMTLTFRKRVLIYQKQLMLTVNLLVLFLAAAVVLLFVFPQSPLSLRIINIFEGTDTSANGRTSDSFTVAWYLIADKSAWFGLGLGQIKIQIEALVHQFLGYWGNYERYDIPNAIGETLAIFGISGLVLRIGLEWYLFFKTNVKTNYYRLSLFIFVFIYQFTGSFITNIVEYVIWILAFSKVFDQFNVTTNKD